MARITDGVPVRTIAVTIAMVTGTLAALALLYLLRGVLVWVAVSAFLATVLSPLVTRTQRWLHLPRAGATSLVFLLGIVLAAGIGTALVQPLVGQAKDFADQVPDYVDQARTGRGPVGHLVQRFDVDDYVREHQDQFKSAIENIGTSTVSALRTVGSVVISIVVILVLSFLFTLNGPSIVDRAVALLAPRHHDRARGVLHHSARAVTGYVTGQLLLATIAGSSTYVVLLLLDVPYRGVIAFFVALTDLLPLVGATIGAIVAVGIAFLHSVTAGVVTLIFFVVYQQLENHLLQPVVQSRTVKLTALTVILSVLVGVELLGILGALFAIPVAGILKVIVDDVRRSGAGPPPLPPDEEALAPAG